MLRPGVRMAQFGRRRVAAAGYSCTLTIGNSSGVLYGYAKSGDLQGFGPFGSISGQPIAGQTLDTLYWDNPSTAFFAAFAGDILSTLTALNVWVNGVNYGGAGSWDNSSGTHTVYEGASGPSLTSGSYLVEIK